MTKDQLKVHIKAKESQFKEVIALILLMEVDPSSHDGIVMRKRRIIIICIKSTVK